MKKHAIRSKSDYSECPRCTPPSDIKRVGHKNYFWCRIYVLVRETNTTPLYLIISPFTQETKVHNKQTDMRGTCMISDAISVASTCTRTPEITKHVHLH